MPSVNRSWAGLRPWGWPWVGLGPSNKRQVSISGNMAEHRIRDLKSILQHIIPIFDKYPLLTSKYFNSDLFKQAALL